MTEKAPHKPHWSAAEIAAMDEFDIGHPLNPNAQVYLRQLGPLAGLKRTGLSLGRIPPGKESFAYHAHQAEEEFVYVLSGRGRAEVNGTFYEIGPGDFLGFPAPGCAHLIANPYDVELVYLMGSDRSPVEFVEFPRNGQRALRDSQGAYFVASEHLRPVNLSDFIRGKTSGAGKK
jgi:uncharacterized cupin superfamily protein